MNAIIIEDEPLVAKDLQKLINKIDPVLTIVAILDSVQASVDYFRSHKEPDILFMDIQLSDGVSFDILSKVKLTCPIIFTTAYDEFAIRAFKLNSIDYLLKPVDKVELKSAIEKFRRMRGMEIVNFSDQINLLMDQIKRPGEVKMYKERFMAHSGKSYIIIDFREIACFIKDVLIYLITKENKKHVTDFQTMDEIEELLDPNQFYRTNRQVIVQVDAVDNFQSDVYSKLKVKLKKPVELTIDVSREKAQAFKTWIHG